MTDTDKKRGTGSTMSTGAPAASDRNSLTIGSDGPIVLHDVHFLEQMAHFNREKVPERQPHAKGSGAFGVFKSTADVSAYTKAALFQKGATTDMLARFSTVAGESGSQTRGGMYVASHSNFIRTKAITTWLETTRRSFSFATP